MKDIDTITNKADALMKWITTNGVDYGMKLLGAIVVLLIGLWVIRIIVDRGIKLMEKSKVDAALRTFAKSMLTVTLKIVLIISVLGMIGIEMTTFIAMLTAASLAVALAFRGSLSNFAGGIMILFFKPFKLGDYVTAMGHGGTVTEIQIFNTYLLTSDNKTVIVPNAHLSNGVLVNNSTQELRRVDWVFGIGYGDNYDTAKDMVLGFLKEDKRVLNSPAEPFIALHDLGDSTVNLVVRAWVKSSDYWGVYFGINENYYKNAEKNEINMPFPQMDVHFDKPNEN